MSSYTFTSIKFGLIASFVALVVVPSNVQGALVGYNWTADINVERSSESFDGVVVAPVTISGTLIYENGIVPDADYGIQAVWLDASLGTNSELAFQWGGNTYSTALGQLDAMTLNLGTQDLIFGGDLDIAGTPTNAIAILKNGDLLDASSSILFALSRQSSFPAVNTLNYSLLPDTQWDWETPFLFPDQFSIRSVGGDDLVGDNIVITGMFDPEDDGEVIIPEPSAILYVICAIGSFLAIRLRSTITT